jgi:hypothetical protein
LRKCIVCGAVKDVWRFKGENLYCKKHYHQMYNHGKIPDKKYYENEYSLKNNYAEMQLKNGMTVLIDLDDVEKAQKYYWGVNTQGYIHSRINGKLTRLHLYLLDFPDRKIDHVNRNKLDNRRNNLRLCEQSQNAKNLSIKKNNTSGFPGVNKIKTSGKWRARIMVDRKEISLGHFNEFEDAVKARIEGERKYFGEFAPNDN